METSRISLLGLLLAGAPALGAQTPGTVKWTATIEGEAYANPTVAPDGKIYYGTHRWGGILYEIDGTDGTILRQIDAPGSVQHAVALSDDGYLYLVTAITEMAAGHPPAKQQAACYDVETLSEVWSSTLPSGSDNSPILGNGRVYHGLVAAAASPDPLPGKHFLAHDADTGTLVIDLPVEGWGATPGVIDEMGRIFFGVEDITGWPTFPSSGIWPGRFYALDPDDPPAGGLVPTPVWTYAASGDFGAPVSYASGVVYTTCRDETMYGFSAKDGTVVFQRHLGAPSWSGIAIGIHPQTGNRIFYTGTLFSPGSTGGERTFYAIEDDGTLAGSLLWSVQLPPSYGGFTFGTPAIDDLGNVYYTTGQGWVQARTWDGALLWEYDLGSTQQSGAGGPTILNDGTIVVGSNGTATSSGALVALYGNGSHLNDQVPWPKYKRDLRNTSNVRTPIRDLGPTIASASPVAAATGGVMTIDGGWLHPVVEVRVDGQPVPVLTASFHEVTVPVAAQAPGFVELLVTGVGGTTILPKGAELHPTLLAATTGIGGTLSLEVDDQLPAPFAVGISSALLPGLLPVPGLHYGLLISPLGALQLASGVMSATPEELDFPVPANPALAGTVWHLQGVVVPGGTPLGSFTNLGSIAF